MIFIYERLITRRINRQAEKLEMFFKKKVITYKNFVFEAFHGLAKLWSASSILNKFITKCFGKAFYRSNKRQQQNIFIESKLNLLLVKMSESHCSRCCCRRKEICKQKKALFVYGVGKFGKAVIESNKKGEVEGGKWEAQKIYRQSF